MTQAGNMSAVATQALREAIAAMLADAGHAGPIGDADSLFLSGRLDSLAAAEVLALLEQDHGLDLTNADFDITQIDTLAQMDELIRRSPA